ncbi:MAG: DNA-processing protein DprA [Bdellovibrionota bacterium]|nr:DNA-processing protein DprA [Bdellovibrionota bacterium]
MKFSKLDLAYYSFYLRSLNLEEVKSFPEEIDFNFLKEYWLLSRKRELPPLPELYSLKDNIFKFKDQKMISIFDEEYPRAFLGLERPPMAFFAKGNLELLHKDSISIVGSRKLQDSVEEWAELHLFNFFQHYKPVVVSGAAFGVDKLAHKMALRCECSTVAILPCGFDNLYPKSFSKMANQILESGGLLVSEYLPLEEVRKHYFHERNRLIAALSRLIFVMQAQRKSGSLVTANIARMMDRELVSLPGDPMNSHFWGSNDLIADGAGFVRDRDDLVNFYFLCNPSTKKQMELRL